MIIKGNTVGHPLADPRKGLSMEGNINMNGKDLTGLKAPVNPTDAVTKKYAEDFAKGLRKFFTVTVPATGWTGTGPYKQTLTAEGILSTDTPHWSVVLSSDADTAIAQKEAFAVVDDLDTANGSITFTCLEDKPEVNLTIQMEVNR